MRYGLSSFVVCCALLTAGFLLPGCACSEFDRARITEDVYISEAYTYEDEGELVISGRAKRGYRNCCDSARGHIDIALISRDGTVIDAFSTLYSPRSIPTVRSRSSSFKVRRPYLPPDGIIIRMAYHEGVEGMDSALYAGGVFDCRKNKATPRYSDGNYRDILTETGRAVSRSPSHGADVPQAAHTR
jgi:hypothetical protein